MTLAPDATDVSLWAHPNAAASGVHALIIGISDYPHLLGGSGAQAAVTGGMGQLEVSARTAARVFDWLNRRGHVGGAPVASCRLLLAPRPGQDKTDVDALTLGHYDDALFTSIRDAAEAWEDALTKGGQSGAPNVAFFFFSGHGVEHLASPALLAQDVLNPSTNRGARAAVSFDSVWRAVKTYGIDRAFFFVDACRNAPDIVRTLNLVGEELLQPAHYSTRAADALLWLQATRAGEFAYQPPVGDASIFGRALLEGLEGLPPDHTPYDRTSVPWRLVFEGLESHVQQRVLDLLREHSTTLIQPVEPGGYPYKPKTLVAEKAPQVPAVLPRSVQPSPPPQPAASPHTGAVPPRLPGDLSLAGVVDAPTFDLLTRRSDSILKTFDNVSRDKLYGGPFIFEISGAVSEADLLDGRALSDFNVMHRVFDSESMTHPWIDSLVLLDADTHAPAPRDALHLVGARAERGENALTAWIDVHVAPARGKALWIQVGGDESLRAHAVVVPRDLNFPMPVRLDVSFQRNANPKEWRWAIDSFTARIAPPNDMPVEAEEVWRPMWDIQRLNNLVNLGSAVRAAADFNVLEQTLRVKEESPVAAALAAALLLRAGALDQLHEWPRNLAKRYSWLPDGAALWAETLLQRVELGTLESSLINEARASFEELASRGPPLLSPVLVLAARRLSFWKQQRKERHLNLACEKIEKAAQYWVPGGMFVAFSGDVAELSPAAQLGRKAPVQTAAARSRRMAG